MESLIAVLALLASPFATYFLRLAWGRYQDRDLFRIRAELYVGLRSGRLGLPRQVVRDLASPDVYELWCASAETGQSADRDRLLARLHEEEEQFVRAECKKNWPRPLGIVIAVITMLAILFSVSQSVEILLPKSQWATFCVRHHMCLAIGSQPTRPPAVRLHEPIVVIPVRTASPKVIPVPRHRLAEPVPIQPEHTRPTRTTPAPSVAATVLPRRITSGCDTALGAVSCTAGKVTAVARQCVLRPLSNLIGVGLLPDLGSTARCALGGLLNRAVPGAAEPASRVRPLPTGPSPTAPSTDPLTSSAGPSPLP